MNQHQETRKYLFLSVCLIIISTLTVSAQNAAEKYAVLGVVKCDEEMAILDGIENKLQADPFATAYFYIYGGKSDTKKNEIEIRGERMKRYLTETRGIEISRVEITEAGFRENFTIEVWFVAVGQTPPPLSPSISRKKVKFKKGKMPLWEEPGCYVTNKTKAVKVDRKCDN